MVIRTSAFGNALCTSLLLALIGRFVTARELPEHGRLPSPPNHAHAANTESDAAATVPTSSMGMQLPSTAQAAAEMRLMEDAPTPQAEPEAADEGDLRLVSRLDINGFATGALEILHNGAFGAVCSARFDSSDAVVACRQMGFVGGTALPRAINERGGYEDRRAQLQDVIAPYVLSNLNCSGLEASLLECPGVTQESEYYDYPYSPYEFTYGLNRDSFVNARECDPLRGNYAFVTCGILDMPGRGELRLSQGGSSKDGMSEYGRLEIFDDGGWGSVCNFDPPSVSGGNRLPVQNNETRNNAAAVVACRQLGFEDGELIQLPVCRCCW
eukprot:jgi/Ulvmu1/6021/UM260_0005.1